MRKEASCEMGAPSVNSVHWQQYRKDDNSQGYKYLEQGSKIAKKEIGIKAALLYEIRIRGPEDGNDPLP